MVRLGDISAGRDNNLNLIRMVAASAVLISHAFPITLGEGVIEPLKPWIGISLGTTAVYAFFAISGFLIAGSYEHARSLPHWFAARGLRLIPGLFVVLALTVLVLGPAVTQLPLGAYFADPQTIVYLPRNILLISQQYGLPGVFVDNPLPYVINGSLWTLFYEVMCYAGVLGLGMLGAFKTKRLMVGFILLYAAFYITVIYSGYHIHFKVTKMAELSLPFMVGVIFYVWRAYLPMSYGLLAALATSTAVLHGTALFHLAFIVAFSYGVFVLGYRPGGWIRRYNNVGDYSYGVYIYAFPMQQLMMHQFAMQSVWLNVLTASLATLVCAVLSWHLIERPALTSREKLIAFLGGRRLRAS